MKYRKKPVEVEAWQWHGDYLENYLDIPRWIIDAQEESRVSVCLPTFGNSLIMRVQTFERTYIAGPGDYIIKGVKGELYPCKPDIFEATYEEVK